MENLCFGSAQGSGLLGTWVCVSFSLFGFILCCTNRGYVHLLRAALWGLHLCRPCVSAAASSYVGTMSLVRPSSRANQLERGDKSRYLNVPIRTLGDPKSRSTLFHNTTGASESIIEVLLFVSSQRSGQ